MLKKKFTNFRRRYGDDENNKIEARFLKTREIPFHSSPNYNSLPSTTSSNVLAMVLKRSKLQREDIPLPSFRREAKSSLPADFQQQFDDNLSSESRHRKNLFIQSGSVNECKRKCHRRRLVDSSIYKMLFEKSNLTPSSIITLLVYPAD